MPFEKFGSEVGAGEGAVSPAYDNWLSTPGLGWMPFKKFGSEVRALKKFIYQFPKNQTPLSKIETPTPNNSISCLDKDEQILFPLEVLNMRDNMIGFFGFGVKNKRASWLIRYGNNPNQHVVEIQRHS